MSMQNDDALRGALRQELDPLAPTAGFEPRVRSRLREHAARRRARAPRMVLSAAVSVALVAAMVGGFIATRGSGTRSISQNAQILQDLTSGAAATPVPDASSSYVWLTAQGEGSACTEAAPYLSSTGGIPPTVPPRSVGQPPAEPLPRGRCRLQPAMGAPLSVRGRHLPWVDDGGGRRRLERHPPLPLHVHASALRLRD
jgi:hypothetical protein